MKAHSASSPANSHEVSKMLHWRIWNTAPHLSQKGHYARTNARPLRTR